MERVRRARHLMAGFLRALWPFGPTRSTQEWVAGLLSDAELRCWERMPGPDQREGVGTARRVSKELGFEPDAEFIAAALLHDVGKRESGLGALGRAIATVAGAIVGHQWALVWCEREGFVRKCGLYLRHDEVGETMLRVAGAREAPSAWARAHHDPARWPALGWRDGYASALARADGERAGRTEGVGP